MKKEKKREKYNFNSLGTRIIGMVVVCIVIPILINALYVIPTSQAALRTSIQNNMLDLAKNNSDILDMLVSDIGVDNVTTDVLTEALQDVAIEGVDSSYAYVVDSDGVFLYHPKEDKIGTTVVNVVINQLLEDMKTGSYQKTGVESYVDENGITKYASYYVSDQTQWVTVIAATESDALGGVNAMARNAMIVIFLVGILLFITGIYMTKLIVRPIKLLTGIIQRTGDLDFTGANQLEMISKRKDETGEMSRATVLMQESLKKMVEHIYTISDHLQNNATSLKKVTAEINSMSTDNSATTQELAASMEETSATMETIDTSTSRIKDNASEISKHAVSILDLSKQLMDRAGNLHETTMLSNHKSTEVYAQVKEKTDAAIEQSKAVERVNDLAVVIQEIASQTSLLSLNASIEAARAGEMGRGFSVVAEEIGKLATQSTQTASDIVDITSDINKAVKLMSDTMSITLDYLDQSVMKDYQTFMSSSNQNNTDAEKVYQAVDNINSMIQELQTATGEIAGAVTGISETVEQAAIGVGDIAQKTTEVVEMSTNVVSVVENTSECSEELNGMAEEFKLTPSQEVLADE